MSVHRQQQRPRQPRRALQPRVERVREPRAAVGERHDVEPVEAVEPLARLEAEAHEAVRLVRLDRVADHAVPAAGADRQRAVEPQLRPRPQVVGPQHVALAAERVDEPSHLLHRGVERARVPALDSHLRPSFHTGAYGSIL
jgi:hypothetical protein